jgi:hypothetical protein
VDTISPLSTAVGSEVTCDGNMTVNGRLACGGVNVGNGSVVVPDNLTVGGVSFASLNFTAIEPLRKVVNLSTGAVELRVDTDALHPYFCAGRVNANATVASSIGRVGYTVHRHSSHPAGVYEIRFNTPAPNNNYVVTLTQQGSGNIKLWDSAVHSGPPTAARLGVVTYNTSWTLVDYIFHFAIVI